MENNFQEESSDPSSCPRCYYCQVKSFSGQEGIDHCIKEHNDKKISLLKPVYNQATQKTTSYEVVHYNKTPEEIQEEELIFDPETWEMVSPPPPEENHVVDFPDEVSMAEGGENHGPDKADEEQKADKADVKSLTKAFKLFVISGSGGKQLPPAEQSKMSNKAANKMIKDANLPIKSQSADIAFSKVKEKGKPFLLIKEFKHFIKQLAIEHARDKAKNPRLPEDDPTVLALEKDFTEKIRESEPKQHGTTKTAKSDAVNRLTDAKGYTGSHKERFDESGKGKGIAGRKNLVNQDGYVTGYKEKDTYEKK